MARTITGRVEVLVNGQALLNKAGAKAGGIAKSGQPPFKRNPIMGDTGMHGFTEEPITPFVECTVSDNSDQMLTDLAEVAGDGTVIFQAAPSGKIYTLVNAYCVNDFEVTAGEGETTVRFEGDYFNEGLRS